MGTIGEDDIICSGCDGHDDVVAAGTILVSTSGLPEIELECFVTSALGVHHLRIFEHCENAGPGSRECAFV